MPEREYLRVTPTSEELTARGIPQTLESLHKLIPDSSGLWSKLNPFTSATPPCFEFLALSTGQDAPVEFYYGADDYLGTLEERLRSIYPKTFDIERVEVDVASKLIHPVALSHEEFVERYQQGDLQYEFTDDEQYSAADVDVDVTPDGGGSAVHESGGSPTDTADEMGGRTADGLVSIGETVVELETTDSLADEVSPTSVEKPTVAAEGTILARPAADAVSPRGVRWCGSAVRKQDWMSSLTPLTATPDESTLPAVDEPGAVLASLIDHLNDAREPLAFQVVFQRRESWQADAELRKEDLNDGRDTLSQKILGDLLDPELEYERRTRDELSDIVVKRLDAIDAVNPKRSYTTNIRAIGVPTNEAGRDALDDRLSSLAPVFDPLDGPFYEIEATRLRDRGFRQSKKEQNARAALQRLLSREVATGRGKTRPELVLCGAELANFVVVPSSERLTMEGSRGTRAEQQSRNPLARPNPDLMSEFREGMAIGYALDETGEAEKQPTRIPPGLLPTHYGRFGTTGAGKSKAQINELLSLYEATTGPSILIEPKGDGMAENYMRAHAARFGLDDLRENVIYFSLPDVLPGFSFFNLEPSLENGLRREDAVQRKADHYEEILKLVMGVDRYERATVAPGLIKSLIKVLFDETHGRENGQYRESADYFAHRQLESVLDQLWQAGPPQPDLSAAPQSSDEAVSRSLRRQLQADKTTFSNVLGGVGNRLSVISDDTHLRRIFNNTEPRFDFRDVIDDDTVILFDLGDLREDAARVMTGVILTNLEDALKEENQDVGKRPEDYVVNLLIDEAASVAVSDVMNTLLEQGRSFRLSVGLSMQFPEQMKAEGGRRAYLNVLNNIGSPIVGKINVDRELARAMAHEEMDPTAFANRIRSLPRGEWIANLPSPIFGETGPYPFSLAPLPIPDGHPESDRPLTESEESRFSETLSRMQGRVDETYGVTTTEAPATELPDELSTTLDITDGELDTALAKVVRAVQLRLSEREANGWVSVETVDDELRRLCDESGGDAPTYDELSTIRQRSRFLETTVHLDQDELVIRLTEAGEAVAAPDTGAVQSAGSSKHDAALAQIEAELTTHGCTVSILSQDGSEKPDGRATHPAFDAPFAIEVETTTPGKPAKVLTNLRKAQEAGEIPMFVVRAGEPEPYWAERVEQVLSPPLRELQSGDTRFYTTDTTISFNGGASEEGGLTALRPVSPESAQTIWSRVDGDLVLEDGAGGELLRVESLDELSKSRLPAVYSYDSVADEYVVYAGGEQYVYDSKEAFTADWTKLKRPFVPEDELPYPGFSSEQYLIVILRNDGDAVIYRDGTVRPLSDLSELDLVAQPTQSNTAAAERAATPTSDESDESLVDVSELADDPDAVVGRFAEEFLRETAHGSVSSERVYNCYQSWVTEQGLSPDSKRWFTRRLRQHVEFDSTVKKDGNATTRHYDGLALTQEELSND
ncbi:type IV secretory system conjugative DNA transfer family protein [Haloferax prahovense]|uniref:type IV secretory system conjugative DNA transfer family protein n=1 Tax=Haloferax prahovense TaxID=381852 RepID=UPI0006790C49|nr:primase-like DNA-binding domain-containing protein [Haloferax prahovense]